MFEDDAGVTCVVAADAAGAATASRAPVATVARTRRRIMREMIRERGGRKVREPVTILYQAAGPALNATRRGRAPSSTTAQWQFPSHIRRWAAGSARRTTLATSTRASEPCV